MFNNTTGTNLFGNNQGNQGGQGNLFGKSQQNPPNNIFGTGQNNTANRPQGSTNLFGNQGGGNNQPSNNIFGNNQNTQQPTNNLFGNNQGGGNLFNQTTGNTTNNLFGQGGNTSNNLFGQNQGSTLFSGNTQGGSYTGGYNQTGAGYNPNATQGNYSTVNENRVYDLINAPLDQQQKIFDTFNTDYLKQLITHYRKSIDVLKNEKFTLAADNPLRNEKITKVATTLNIKPQIVQVKKLVRDNVTNKVKQLKQNNDKMEKLSASFAEKVFEKLQKYKQKLVLAVTQSKMIEEIKKEVEELYQETNQFFKPLFNANQSRTNFTFFDPSPFCVSVSEKLLRNMAALDNRLDQILACEGDIPQQNVDTADVIVQLVEYYENVAITLKDFSLKYNDLKKRILQRSRQSNPEQAMKKLSDRANSIVKKQMEAYQIVKEIQSLLERRERKMTEKSRI